MRLFLAAAYGPAERIQEAKQELAEHLRLWPEFRSLAVIRARVPQMTQPAFLHQAKGTLDVGLRRAGMPDS